MTANISTDTSRVGGRGQNHQSSVIGSGETTAEQATASYRIYFFGERLIRGRHDFDADNDQAAIQVAHVLFDACSDDCRSFDLWEGRRRIVVPRRFVPSTFEELSEATQECILDTEERIANSEWNIASSRRLLAMLERRKIERRCPWPQGAQKLAEAKTGTACETQHLLAMDDVMRWLAAPPADQNLVGYDRVVRLRIIQARRIVNRARRSRPLLDQAWDNLRRDSGRPQR